MLLIFLKETNCISFIYKLGLFYFFTLTYTKSYIIFKNKPMQGPERPYFISSISCLWAFRVSLAEVLNKNQDMCPKKLFSCIPASGNTLKMMIMRIQMESASGSVFQPGNQLACRFNVKWQLRVSLETPDDCDVFVMSINIRHWFGSSAIDSM